MQCPKCGLDNIVGAMYCEDCGTLLKQRDSSRVSQPPPVRAPAREPQYQRPEPVRQAPPPPPVAQGRYTPPQAPVTPGRYAPPTVPVAPPFVNCPRCRKENDPSAVYCGGCGLSLRGTGGIPGSPKCYGKLVPLGGGNEYWLDRDKMVIGRRSEAENLYPEIDLGVLDDSTGVSRKHAQIVWDGNIAIVEDLGSSNGTFLNDVRITEGIQTPIKDGDSVRFGGYSFIFRKLSK